jgi:hypothetical protein
MMGVEVITGGCNCGFIRYTLAEPPLAVVACHCTSCRRQSGAAYSVNLVVRASTMTVEGELGRWIDPDTESGEPLAREFCRACGSPIRSAPSSPPKMLAVKAGTLDQPDDFAPSMHIWTASKLPWVTIGDGLPQFARGPQA